MDKVTLIIEEGGIPLVKCIREGLHDLRLDVVKADLGVEYTAISHVWADSLDMI